MRGRAGRSDDARRAVAVGLPGEVGDQPPRIGTVADSLQRITSSRIARHLLAQSSSKFGDSGPGDVGLGGVISVDRIVGPRWKSRRSRFSAYFTRPPIFRTSGDDRRPVMSSLDDLHFAAGAGKSGRLKSR